MNKLKRLGDKFMYAAGEVFSFIPDVMDMISNHDFFLMIGIVASCILTFPLLIILSFAGCCCYTIDYVCNLFNHIRKFQND